MTPPLFKHDDSAPATPEQQDNRKATGLAVAVHVLLLVALILGV
ncbi:MAG: protein TolA, partial [Bordetella sp.]|nr:protein TolA [Bordetella sp.]